MGEPCARNPRALYEEVLLQHRSTGWNEIGIYDCFEMPTRAGKPWRAQGGLSRLSAVLDQMRVNAVALVVEMTVDAEAMPHS